MESKYEGVAPKLVLLSLLAECCMVTTTQTQVSPDQHMMITLTTDPMVTRPSVSRRQRSSSWCSPTSSGT